MKDASREDHLREEPGPSLDEIDGLTVLQALSDPVRLEIVRQLAGCPDASELKCGQIELPVTKSTASHHFKILFAAGTRRPSASRGRASTCGSGATSSTQRFPGLLDSVLNATA